MSKTKQIEKRLSLLEEKFKRHNHDNAVERINALEEILAFFKNWITTVKEK